MSRTPVRVALLMNLSPNKIGSIEDWLVEMASAARARGHTLDVFAHEPVHPVVRQALEAGGAGFFPISDLLAAPLRACRRLSKQYDVVQLHFWGPRERMSLVALGSWPTRVLYVDHSSGSLDDELVAPSVLRRAIDRVTAFPYAGFSGVSDYVRDRLRLRLGVSASRVRTIHNGVRLERFRDQPRVKQDDRLIILAVSQLIREKGLDVLLRAVARTGLERFQVQIAGEGPERPALSQLAHDLGLAERVVFLGVRSDVESLLQQCDLFVHPAIWQEAFGLVVAEAMASGRPVIATQQGALPELVIHGETGLLVPPDDPDALAAAISQLAGDPSRRLAFGLAAHGRAQQFSMTASAQRHLDWCESVVINR